eukprot:1156350-Pelagomonas_calceolata.AAC.13
MASLKLSMVTKFGKKGRTSSIFSRPSACNRKGEMCPRAGGLQLRRMEAAGHCCVQSPFHTLSVLRAHTRMRRHTHTHARPPSLPQTHINLKKSRINCWRGRRGRVDRQKKDGAS